MKGTTKRVVFIINTTVEGTILTTATETPPLDDFSDIDYIFDTQRKIKLKKDLHMKTVLQFKH